MPILVAACLLVSCRPQAMHNAAEPHPTLEDLLVTRNVLLALRDAAEAAEHQWQATALHLNSVEGETQRFEAEAERLQGQLEKSQQRLAELWWLLQRNREYLRTNGTSRVVAEKTVTGFAQRRRGLDTELMMTEAKIREMKAANKVPEDTARKLADPQH
jgi:outer membrane PBP1 activator LpoA protein